MPAGKGRLLMSPSAAKAKPSHAATILVVDDLDVNRQIRCAVLKQAGYQVLKARDGCEALQVASKNPPDLTLSDILMPGMDGFELCRAWKSDARFQSVPFVFYSATYTEPKDQEFALRLGADAFLRKGADNQEFLAEIARLLDAPIHHPDNEVRDEGVFYREHSERVVRKLEDKLSELERANQEISDREEQLQAAKRQLEQRVAERTAELVAINKELESFAYTVSHDLRAPLRLINAISHEMLEAFDDNTPASLLDNANRIRRAANRMNRLIDELLELSRVTRRVLKRERVNLSNMAREVIDELLLSMPDRRVDVNIQSGLFAIADRELLHIVLSNLFDNALKYTSREDKPWISLEQRTEQGQIVYAVQDNGVGFDQREANKLFMPFQRLHRQDEFEGAGIGLATVARIVHRHGGGVWAKGEVGEGATFLFSIPEV
jgi:signal transduction histidine kinase